MNTSQQVIGQYNTTERTLKLAPWIIGAVTLLVALLIWAWMKKTS